uniref:GATA-type domain-containing protein n=1 Tax=Meloidogyne hapla TaxID=6305 RepID=A0A1I8B987_MELHA
MIKSLRILELNEEKNIFVSEVQAKSRFIPNIQLSKKIVIQITNNQFIKNLIPGFDKQVIINNEFVKNEENNYYETSILDKNNIKLNDRQLKSFDAKNKSVILTKQKRQCFICKDTKPLRWYGYLKENYLCNACHEYNKRNYGKQKPATKKLV